MCHCMRRHSPESPCDATVMPHAIKTICKIQNALQLCYVPVLLLRANQPDENTCANDCCHAGLILASSCSTAAMLRSSASPIKRGGICAGSGSAGAAEGGRTPPGGGRSAGAAPASCVVCAAEPAGAEGLARGGTCAGCAGPRAAVRGCGIGTGGGGVCVRYAACRGGSGGNLCCAAW